MARSDFRDTAARHVGHVALSFVRRARGYREHGDRVMAGYYVRQAREAWRYALALEDRRRRARAFLAFPRPMGAPPLERRSV